MSSSLGKFAGRYFGNYFGAGDSAVVVEVIEPGTSSPTPGGGGRRGGGGRLRDSGVFYRGEPWLERIVRSAIRESVGGRAKRPSPRGRQLEAQDAAPSIPSADTDLPAPSKIDEAVYRLLGTPLFNGLSESEDLRRLVSEEMATVARYEPTVFRSFVGGFSPAFAVNEEDELAIVLALI